MKINNNNLRAAKRRYNKYVPRYIADFVWPEGFNGTSSKDFEKTESCGGIPSGFISEEEFVHNRTQEKSENSVKEQKDKPPGATQ
tara:strand:- start:91 stop:345 length:255 start_codon:yes stop_codon:yes gene_type:complete